MDLTILNLINTALSESKTITPPDSKLAIDIISKVLTKIGTDPAASDLVEDVIASIPYDIQEKYSTELGAATDFKARKEALIDNLLPDLRNYYLEYQRIVQNSTLSLNIDEEEENPLLTALLDENSLTEKIEYTKVLGEFPIDLVKDHFPTSTGWDSTTKKWTSVTFTDTNFDTEFDVLIPSADRLKAAVTNQKSIDAYLKAAYVVSRLLPNSSANSTSPRLPNINITGAVTLGAGEEHTLAKTYLVEKKAVGSEVIEVHGYLYTGTTTEEDAATSFTEKRNEIKAMLKAILKYYFIRVSA